MPRRRARGLTRVGRWLTALSCLAAIHIPAASVFAQQKAQLKDEGGTLLQIAIAVGILIVTAAAAFINPKRTHLG